MHVLQPSSFSLNFLSATFSHQEPRVVYKKICESIYDAQCSSLVSWWVYLHALCIWTNFSFFHTSYNSVLYSISYIIGQWKKNSFGLNCFFSSFNSKWIIKESMYCLNLTNVNQSLHERIWTDVSLKTIFSQHGQTT